MKYKSCTIEGCKRNGIADKSGIKYFCKGYCSYHYYRLKKYGSPQSRVYGDPNSYRTKANYGEIDLRNKSCSVVGITKVPLDMLDELLAYRWCVDSSGYAIARIDGRLQRLHKLVLDSDGHIDHINRDKLDNRRKNLRVCTPEQNARNKTKLPNKTSRFYGVSRTQRYKKIKWAVYAKFPKSGSKRYWGAYDTEKEAAVAYNNAAKQYGDNFTVVNAL